MRMRTAEIIIVVLVDILRAFFLDDEVSHIIVCF
jgi:hypothetical protein